jgi:hypothetical protein
MLIIPLFAILLALKLAAIALVYHAGPAAAIPVILACILIANLIEPAAARRRPQERR